MHRTTPNLHWGVSPVVACDLARGFARLGLRSPHLYSIACTVVARGVAADVEGGAGRGAAAALGRWRLRGMGAAGALGDDEALGLGPAAAQEEGRRVRRGLAGEAGGTWAAGGSRDDAAGTARVAAAPAQLLPWAAQLGRPDGSYGSSSGSGGFDGGSGGVAGGSRGAWGSGVWVGSGGGHGPSGLGVAGLVDLVDALAVARHYDPLLLDCIAQRLAQVLSEA